MAFNPNFAQLVSLACHDLRTPLATVHGFARTIAQREELSDRAGRYISMMEAASVEMSELLEVLSLAARIVDGRYHPALARVDTLELARSAGEALAGHARVSGRAGAQVNVDVEATKRALAALAECALRHGGLEDVELRADREEIAVRPIVADAAPIVLGEQLRDLGAAGARMLIEALGGSLRLDEEALLVRLPVAEPSEA